MVAVVKVSLTASKLLVSSSFVLSLRGLCDMGMERWKGARLLASIAIDMIPNLEGPC